MKWATFYIYTYIYINIYLRFKLVETHASIGGFWIDCLLRNEGWWSSVNNMFHTSDTTSIHENQREIPNSKQKHL